MTQPLFMVGARGCGKTTVGQTLARVLGCAFTDTDEMLWRSNGKTVADIVAEEGWMGFRARESEILASVTQGQTVVATGGGIILSAANRRFIRARGTVVYLNVSAQELARRLQAYPEEAQRPSLTGKPMIEEIAEVLATREKLYQEAAHHIVDASQAPDDVVYTILQQLSSAISD
ncbi:shikimate kinase [Sodalis-like endosymbiont of Proechinophthirus fluctus]|uniref:shikimate kinase AroL n=1 Tax=Sodalis-like endosymbiont of Proechinophthirus fluctus TaxID=1462730 RepID=UPI0007A869D1|nr:shikimate kinase AroL [Sodalis-like endosymbiont of Proechinophthirus fluctus]KYP97362.1 shikimate kinase [Sodalis-like endosymbiont of Proechinophthirus fluctus]